MPLFFQTAQNLARLTSLRVSNVRVRGFVPKSLVQFFTRRADDGSTKSGQRSRLRPGPEINPSIWLSRIPIVVRDGRTRNASPHWRRQTHASGRCESIAGLTDGHTPRTQVMAGVCLLLALCTYACSESISGPSAEKKGRVMAGDSYDQNMGTDTSNGNGGDWWNQNAPPPPQITASHPSAPNGIPDPNKPGFDTAGWPLASTPNAPGNQITHDPEGGTTISNTGMPNAGPGPSASWGGPVAPYSGSPYPGFTPPPLPASLQQGFQLPSAADLQATPGYMERFKMGQQARERGAASRGTILNGGTQQALTRYGQDYASGEYNNLAQQKLGERQQQSQDYLNLAYGPAWQSNQAAVNQYGNLYSQYRNLIGDNRNAQSDYWNQQMELLNAGLGAAKSGNPGSTGGQG